MAADKKISQLPASDTLDGTELVPIVQDGVTVQTTTQNIADLNTPALQDLQSVTTVGNTTTNPITANSFVKNGGTASQFLKANGTVDNNIYITSVDIPNFSNLIKQRVRAGEDLIKGQVVYASGSNGTDILVQKADNRNDPTVGKVLGIIAENLPINNVGFVITEGTSDGVDTSSATEGDPVWLGINGNYIFGLINKPNASDALVFIGIVRVSDAVNGSIFVKIQNGLKLSENNEVDLITTTLTNGQVLTYESSTGLWKNKTVVSALGFTPYNATNPSGYITSSALSTYAPIANPTFTSAITTPIINGVSGNLSFNNAVQTSGAITAFTFTKPNNTTQTASTQINGFVVNGGSRQWLTGNITAQSENVWGATTYSFVAPSTITNAYGNVFNAPIAGTNATITNNWAAQFNGNVVIGSTGQLIEIKQTANAPTYTQTGASSSVFRLNSGNRSLLFETYGTDQNYVTSYGGVFRIRTGDALAIEFYTTNTRRLTILPGGGILFAEANDIQTGTTTGTKIGTVTTQKLAFWNAIPIVQPANTVSLNGVLETTGLMASGSTISTINKPLVVGTNTSPRTGVATDGVTSVLGDLKTWAANYHSGEVLYSEVSGEALNFGQLCYRNASGKWQKATGSSATIAAYNMLGVCLQTVGSTDTAISILTRGYVESTYLSAGAVGNPLFMDATTAGSITNTAPSTTGNVVRIIGNVFWSSALQTNAKWIVYFNPDNTWIEL